MPKRRPNISVLIFTRIHGCVRQTANALVRSVKFVTWQSMYEPIDALLTAQDEAIRNRLTTVWRDCKINELTTVGYTVRIFKVDNELQRNMLTRLQSALVASVIASTFSWSQISSSPWTTRAVWYGSLILSMSSISVSTHQVITLHRIGSHPEALEKIRLILGKNVDGGAMKPRSSQLYVWQIPVMLLTVSIALFIIGLVILVFQTAFALSSRVWTDDKKVG